jgi:hypothetical protein
MKLSFCRFDAVSKLGKLFVWFFLTKFILLNILKTVHFVLNNRLIV